jgi:SAM-dependent methyltransferase
MTCARETSRFRDVNINGPVSYWLLHKFIDRSQIHHEDVFYDVGCGHGRVLCFVARKRVSKCVGIELSAEFAARAQVNARTLRGRLSPIEVHVGDAADADYEEGTVFFFGDPFGHKTLRLVLARIWQTLAARPRRVLCIFWIPSFVDPLVEESIRSTGWLTYSGTRSVFYSPMRAEYWTHEPYFKPFPFLPNGRFMPSGT